MTLQAQGWESNLSRKLTHSTSTENISPVRCMFIPHVYSQFTAYIEQQKQD